MSLGIFSGYSTILLALLFAKILFVSLEHHRLVLVVNEALEKRLI